ncbi:alpha-glucosidase [Nakamurella endophytica]|uniref:Alpha-glucosidase n=1 Tax=Nakamurella endophytica TaxID=1748367 RepID=A0A917SNS5_9ACTN|nr:alpha-glucosidase [Nakamurella endophytica]GGL89428.1 alpha-glucosidase [Nakamurella endophytica]
MTTDVDPGSHHGAPAPGQPGAETAAGPEAAPPWWTSAVVYQVYPRSFADADGDGIGDLRGIIGRLDHLAELGVDVVWLSPIYRSPQDDNGYDISDYQDVDPVFGTLADLDELIRELHERGMKLVMDLVVNHTSDEHPWFVESASSRDAAKRDWYWWRDPRPGTEGGALGAEPTNWGSFFSGSAWLWHEETGQYVLHLFSTKQPDLNWENPEVRAAVHAMMRWWLDRGVDGFRMDVINLVSKRLPLQDAPPTPGSPYAEDRSPYTDGPRIHEYLQEMHREVFAGRSAALITVGETPGVTIEQARLYTDRRRAEVDMVFQFEHVGLDYGPGGKWDHRPLDRGRLIENLSRWQEGLADVGWNSLYWDNHDQPRAVSRFGNDGRFWAESAKALATVLHLQRGTPYVYQGEEIGMTNADLASPADLRDIESINFLRAATLSGVDAEAALAAVRPVGRDNARTPMQWDDGPEAGFTTGTPWIPVNRNHDRINAAAQRGRAGSVFEHYRALIELRHREPVVAVGDWTHLPVDPGHVFAFRRAHAGDQLLVVANLGDDAVRVSLPAGSVAGEEILHNHAGPSGPVGGDGSADTVPLRPWEARVWLRHAPAGG